MSLDFLRRRRVGVFQQDGPTVHIYRQLAYFLTAVEFGKRAKNRNLPIRMLAKQQDGLTSRQHVPYLAQQIDVDILASNKRCDVEPKRNLHLVTHFGLGRRRGRSYFTQHLGHFSLHSSHVNRMRDRRISRHAHCTRFDVALCLRVIAPQV
ncbi:MAG: hypothetical protein COW33_05920 [Anaerolineae bacterium CG17_big_fil_post_rev_8_21_14_2_50_57_27]|nr:MAG: hypothetical protein COW33_05920 [Anaerolineae bacterium CG17_big_fil_post_rev_8_21_14_2_50_57_27]